MSKMTAQKYSFDLDDDQAAKLEKWTDALKEIYGEVGTLEFRFKPMGIGTCAEVYSENANASISLTDVSKW